MKCCVRLKSLNTFSIDVSAERIITVYNEYGLLSFWKEFFNQGIPVLILGSGSNILFLENYIGIILLNRIKGILITEDEEKWQLHVGAGEKWNDLVIYTLRNNMPGLENLACIPGYVGAAPVQNIGAYGVEFSQICEYVDALEVLNGKKIRFTTAECNFQYRNSIFKKYSNKYIIIFVGLKLYKNWKPVLKHCRLTCFQVHQVTPYQIFNIIYLTRKMKLPDPSVFGNAGSFFKNPIVNIKTAYYLFKHYPDMPYFIQSNNKIKLSAGWLIEQCQLKGYLFGEAAVYHKQALILINVRQMATGTEIAALAFFIYKKVSQKFGICLKPEVRLIGSYGEIDPNELFI